MKKIMLPALGVAALLTACGDETTVVNQTGIAKLNAGEVLDECDASNDGDMVFVTDSATVYICSDEKWISLNGKDGTSSVDTVVIKDSLVKIDTLVLNHTDSIYVRDTTVVYDTTIVYDTTTVRYEPEYDTVTTEFLNQEMLAAGGYEIFVDKRDNKVYRTVKIGTQTWFAQNLNYTDGGVTSYCRMGDAWEGEAWCKNYGRLYPWADALNLGSVYNSSSATKNDENYILRRPARGVCPEGFHIPDSVEFNVLIDYAKSYNTVKGIETSAVASLKSENGKWADVDGVDKGSNILGFSSVANGALDAGMTAGVSYILSNEASATQGINVLFSASSDEIVMRSVVKTNPYNVRCLKND